VTGSRLCLAVYRVTLRAFDRVRQKAGSTTHYYLFINAGLLECFRPLDPGQYA
jgi:hypothetical protein